MAACYSLCNSVVKQTAGGIKVCGQARLGAALGSDQVSQKCVSRLGETTLACKSGRLVETKRHIKKKTLRRDPAEVCMRG